MAGLLWFELENNIDIKDATKELSLKRVKMELTTNLTTNLTTKGCAKQKTVHV